MWKLITYCGGSLVPEWYLLPHIAQAAFHLWGQTSLDISGQFCISFSCIHSPSSVQVSGRTSHRSIQTLNSSCTLLDGGSLASHSSQHVGGLSFSVSYHKRSHKVYFGTLSFQWSAIVTFNHLAAQRPILGRQRSVSDGYMKHLQQIISSSVGKNGEFGVLDRVSQTMPFPSLNLLIVLLYLPRVGQVWHTIYISYSAISAFLEP